MRRRLNLTPSDVHEIRIRLALGETQAAIAKEMSCDLRTVSQRTISHIATGQTWRHLRVRPQAAPVTRTDPPPATEPRCIVLPDSGDTTGDYGIWPDGSVITWKQREPAILKPRILPSGNRRVWLRCYDKRAGYLVRDLVRSTWDGYDPGW